MVPKESSGSIESSVDPQERYANSSHQNLVTLAEVEVWARVERFTGILPSQSNDVMMEYFEREALSEVSFEVRLEEIVSSLEEIPSVVKLDTPQLGKLVLLVLGAESIVDGGCREDCDRANGSNDELAVLADDGIQDGGVESGHG